MFSFSFKETTLSLRFQLLFCTCILHIPGHFYLNLAYYTPLPLYSTFFLIIPIHNIPPLPLYHIHLSHLFLLLIWFSLRSHRPTFPFPLSPFPPPPPPSLLYLLPPPTVLPFPAARSYNLNTEIDI